LTKFVAVRSPLTATVATWLVEDGARVAFDDQVVELEAMKMFTPVSAPASGILRYRATLGEVVGEGDLLAVIEKD